MGLFATVDFNYPTETPELGLPIDYSDALDEFCSTFVDTAQGMAPVDTGYLRSTIDASPSGDTSASCEETCEYAEYQEYGTWCMGAQPHFEPALYEAAAAAEPSFAEIYAEALEEEAELLEEMEAAEAAGRGGTSALASGGAMSGGGLGSWLAGTLAVALVSAIFAFIKEIFSTDGFDSKGSGGGRGDGDSVGGFSISIS